MKSHDIGEIHSASVVESGGKAVLSVKGTNGVTRVTIPEGMAVPFRDTAREIVRVYDDDAEEPSDGLDTLP